MFALKKTIITFSLIFIIGVFQNIAQQGYNIKIQIELHSDSIYFLANYFGDKFYIADTSSSEKGLANFTGDESLHQGIYILANEKKEKLIEFLVGDTQHFTINLKNDLNPETVSVNESIDNDLLLYTISCR